MGGLHGQPSHNHCQSQHLYCPPCLNLRPAVLPRGTPGLGFCTVGHKAVPRLSLLRPRHREDVRRLHQLQHQGRELCVPGPWSRARAWRAVISTVPPLPGPATQCLRCRLNNGGRHIQQKKHHHPLKQLCGARVDSLRRPISPARGAEESGEECDPGPWGYSLPRPRSRPPSLPEEEHNDPLVGSTVLGQVTIPSSACSSGQSCLAGESARRLLPGHLRGSPVQQPPSPHTQPPTQDLRAEDPRVSAHPEDLLAKADGRDPPVYQSVISFKHNICASV